MDKLKQLSGKELHKNLNLVILGVTFGIAFFTVIGGPPLTGFARALGAGDLVYGIIMAMPVVGGVLQIFASYFLENTGKRKLIFLFSGFIHRLLWIPIAIIPLVLPSNAAALKIWAITVLITVSSAANAIVGVSFQSWMGALVPIEIRGRFFSKRTAIFTFAGAIFGVAAGRFLDLVPGFKGFAAVFIVVALFGVADILCFIWIKDPPMPVPEERIPFFKLFFEPFRNKNYMRFIAYVAVWNFGVNFSGPFFNVYMLEYLNMSYFAMSVCAQALGNIATVLFIRKWGNIVDTYGNKPVMTLCCCCIAPLPLLWFFATPQNYMMVLVINFISGIFWPGFDMTAFNQSIWLAPEKNRSIYLASYTLLTALAGTALGYICGGGFLQFAKPMVSGMNIPFVMGQKLNGFHLLFVLSCLIRVIAVLFLLPRFREENSKPLREVIRMVRRA